VEPYDGIELHMGGTVHKSVETLATLLAQHFRVTKMKFAKKRDPETNKSINDKTTVIYNDYLTLRDIPWKPTTTW
jgi:predicted helicase